MSESRSEVARIGAASDVAGYDRRIIAYGTIGRGLVDFTLGFREFLAGAGVGDVTVVPSRHIGHIKPVFYGWRRESTERPEDTPPLGVVMFPEMRDRLLGAGLTVTTPVGDILALCQKHAVPVVYLDRFFGPTEVTLGMQQLATSILAKSLPPAGATSQS